jgi:hypothetical protein
MTDKELMEMGLDEMLVKISFKSLEMVTQGNGWVGRRYVLHTYNYGSSYPCETFDEVKQWIICNIGFQLRR